jgi:peptidyl-prolyl cis-trans isomerase C
MRALTILCCLSFTGVAFAQSPTITKPADKPVAKPVQKPLIKPQALKLPQMNKKLRGPKRLVKGEDASSLPPVTGQGGLIAKVNGVGIKIGDFSTQYDRFAESFKARKRPMPLRLAQRYRKTIVKRLVNEELVRQEAKRLKITPTAAQLDEELKGYKAMFKTEKRFEQYLQSAKIDLAKVKENLTQGLLLKLLLEKSQIAQISDEEVRAHYEKQKARYEVKEKVRASHILIKLEKGATPEQVNAARQKAQGLADKARKGEDFAALAKANSEGPTASRGGDLNYFARNRMVKEFDEKAFTMKIGEISDPVRTRFGWHVIKLVDRKDAHTRGFEEVGENIRRMLEGRAQRQARADIIKRLREKSEIEVYLPKEKEEKKQVELKK